MINPAQYAQYSEYYQGMDHGPFDFESIMLYSSFNTKNSIDPSIPLITKKDGTTFFAQNNGLSAGDIAGIKAMYPNRAPLNYRYYINDSYTEEHKSGYRKEVAKYDDYVFMVKQGGNVPAKLKFTIRTFEDSSDYHDPNPWEWTHTLVINPGERFATFNVRKEYRWDDEFSGSWWRERNEVLSIEFSAR